MSEPERDLTDEEFVDLAVALVHVLFDPEPPERQRLRRVHGRLRPVKRGLTGRPLEPWVPETVDGDGKR